MILKRNCDVILRKIHGSIFLIDISDNYSGDKCSLYEINETGRFLWDNIDNSGTVDGLAKMLQDVIIDDVSYELLLKDVVEFINDLKEKKFILEVVVNE